MKKLNAKPIILALFLLLGILLTLLTLYSAKIYEQIVKDEYKNNTAAIATEYITEKIKQCNLANSVQIQNDMITISDDQNIQTIIYQYDGYLCEANIYADKQFQKNIGEKLFAITDMKFILQNELIIVTITDDKHQTSQRILKIYER